MIITIDGPAGAGKSTVARALAKRLGFDYLDTGAFYRVATWKALQEGVDLGAPHELARVAREAKIEFRGRGRQRRVFCDGRDVTEEIRRPEVTAGVRALADLPEVRKALIEKQRRFAEGRDVVTEGRDQGTEVWPDAEVKFYLDASLDERAERRLQDLREAGWNRSLDQVRAEIARRDAEDRARPVGRLRCTEDMIVIDSTQMSVEEVVERAAREVARRYPERLGTARRRSRDQA